MCLTGRLVPWNKNATSISFILLLLTHLNGSTTPLFHQSATDKVLKRPESAVAAQLSKLLFQFLTRSTPPVSILPQRCTEPAFKHWCWGKRDGGNFQLSKLSHNKHIPEKFSLNQSFVCETPFSHCLLWNSRCSRDGQLKTDWTHLYSLALPITVHSWGEKEEGLRCAC